MEGRGKGAEVVTLDVPLPLWRVDDVPFWGGEGTVGIASLTTVSGVHLDAW